MAGPAITNIVTTFAAVGNREDIVDKIFNLSATDCPFQAAIGKVKAEATLHEWQTDVLSTATSNAVQQGDDSLGSAGFTYDAFTATVRLGNRSQISRKTVAVSGTQDAVSKAGRKKEIVYQLLKKGKELNRDMEWTLSGNSVKSTGNASSAPTLAALEAWYGQTTSDSSANVSRGAGGSNSSNSQQGGPTDGTQRPFTESLLKGVLQGCWINGGDVDLIMTGAFNKTVLSTFTGNNTRIQDTSDKKLISAIDVYVSDFGTHKVVASRFSRARSVHCIMSDMYAVATLRPKQTIDVAKTGDNEKAIMLCEYTLESRNDSGSGIVADCTTS